MTLKSEGEERDCNRRISSANKKSFTEEGKWRSERSLMKIRNKSGPRIDPWGTPLPLRDQPSRIRVRIRVRFRSCPAFPLARVG